MSAPKHTPGPWSWDYAKHEAYEVLGADGTLVTEMPLNLPPSLSAEEREQNIAGGRADARLIAAAPELLDAARTAADMLQHRSGHFSEEEWLRKAASCLRAAIAKATGGDK